MYWFVTSKSPSEFSYSGKYNDELNERNDDFPVENVSWTDAREFCEKLSQESKKSISLPAEAQWEYACRAGSDGPYYNAGQLSEIAWFNEWKDGSVSLPMHETGMKEPNAWGLYDMSGHVREWCADYYGAYPAGSEATTDPTGPSQGTLRVIRGGGWGLDAASCRSASRDKGESEKYKNKNLGFRIVMSASEN